jgi:acetyl-CoA synthetase
MAHHPDVVEAAIVAIPHAIKGEGIYVFVTCLPGIKFDSAKAKELKQHIRDAIGAFAQPDVIQNASGLPKTRSGTDFGNRERHERRLTLVVVASPLLLLFFLSFFFRRAASLVPPLCSRCATGKIMRRILRKIATFEESSLGDTSTLADPSVIESLLADRPPPSGA